MQRGLSAHGSRTAGRDRRRGSYLDIAGISLYFTVKRMKGFEPSTFAMARRRSSQLSYIRKVRAF